jgi:methylglutaconyl-CoA hydratase
MEPAVIVEAHERPGVFVVALNRPEQHNALNRRLIGELTTTFRSFANREDVRAIVFTGNGRSFCAGADLQSTMATANAGYDLAREDGQKLFDLMKAVDSCPVPVIGRVNGAAIGGGMGLVCCCDIVVAADRARFAFSEVRLGLIPAVISPFVLAKIDQSQARELFLTGERFDTQRAREIGLVHWVAPAEDLDEKIAERVDQLLLGAPGAQAAAKKLLREAASRPHDTMHSYTSDLFARRVVSQEGQEGIRAFFEKRRPDWTE